MLILEMCWAGQSCKPLDFYRGGFRWDYKSLQLCLSLGLFPENLHFSFTPQPAFPAASWMGFYPTFLQQGPAGMGLGLWQGRISPSPSPPALPSGSALPQQGLGSQAATNVPH